MRRKGSPQATNPVRPNRERRAGWKAAKSKTLRGSPRRKNGTARGEVCPLRTREGKRGQGAVGKVGAECPEVTEQ